MYSQDPNKEILYIHASALHVGARFEDLAPRQNTL